MKIDTKLDFTINKDTNTIHVKRDFAAHLNMVWAAWTTPELLDQWWAPKPYQTQTKSMDFTEGGTWLYAMVSPEGQKHWCRADYQKIETLRMYAALDAFCDEEGKLNPDFPRQHWTNSFSENNGTTTVNITIRYNSVEDMEKIVGMGFREGFTMAMGNLDELLAAQ